VEPEEEDDDEVLLLTTLLPVAPPVAPLLLVVDAPVPVTALLVEGEVVVVVPPALDVLSPPPPELLHAPASQREAPKAVSVESTDLVWRWEVNIAATIAHTGCPVKRHRTDAARRWSGGLGNHIMVRAGR
jgi:hypothetical protein